MKLQYGPYSPSRLDTGLCGYSFYKQYIDPNRDKKRKENLPQARGSAVHEVFESITKKMIENQNCAFSHEEIRGLITDAINRHPAAYQEIDAIYGMAKDYIRRPPKVLTKDAEIELKLAIKWAKNADGTPKYFEDQTVIIDGKPAVRPVFEECDYDDPEAFARGRADILLISDDTTKAIIYDHKTQPNMEEADTFQMGFYAWVISRYYPFLSEISTILHFARYGVYSAPIEWTPEQLWQIETQVMDRVHNIESREQWDAVPNSKCQYCPFLSQCPAMQEYLSVDEATGNFRVHAQGFKILNDTNKAVKIAGLISVMEEAVKVAKDELKAFIKNAGAPIAIPGKVYEFRGSEAIDWTKVNGKYREQAYKVFEKHGIDPKLFMGFSQTFSKGVWMTENEALVKELAELFPRKLETEFKGWKM